MSMTSVDCSPDGKDDQGQGGQDHRPVDEDDDEGGRIPDVPLSRESPVGALDRAVARDMPAEHGTVNVAERVERVGQTMRERGAAVCLAPCTGCRPVLLMAAHLS